jgi:hypothetical protein
MKSSKSAKKGKMPIEKIEEMAMRGEDVSQFFDYSKARAMPPVDKVERVKRDIQRVNVDFANSMLKELDQIAEDINVPRQSLIKTMLRDAINHYYENRRPRKTSLNARQKQNR